MLEGSDVCGTFHDNFPRFSGFEFWREIARMKLYGKDKASKYNERTISPHEFL